eukprot:TRINITY_DN1220_c0_g1_i3.p1 TRINITY_DN1220_c0_g1~~TRINITY_DN1220_c0_g1_i3.p1  ORF type:complete len:288 (-),score=33.87 TRINITY_DN1220_c0_g1_i3:59-922(-)
MQHTDDLLAPPFPMKIGKDLINQLGTRALPYNIPMNSIQTMAESADHLLLLTECPAARESLNKYYIDGKYAETMHKFSDLWQELIRAYPEITMQYIEKGGHAVHLCDFLICSDNDGVRPYYVSDNAIEKCKEFIGTAQREELSYTPELIKASTKPFAFEILAMMNQTIEGLSKVKYAVYAAHDSTLTRLLVGLREVNSSISWVKTPPLAGNVLFELEKREQQEEYDVKIYYSGVKIHNEPYGSFKEKLERAGDVNVTYEEACKGAKGSLRAKRVEWSSFMDDKQCLL